MNIIMIVLNDIKTMSGLPISRISREQQNVRGIHFVYLVNFF